MTITFANDNDAIVYALEKIISYARNHQYIFLAQSVWWISSIIGLQEGSVIHIDNLKAREILGEPEFGTGSAIPNIHPDRVVNHQNYEDSYNTSEGESISPTESDIHNEVIENWETFLEQSKLERKAIGRKPQQASRVIKRQAKKPIKTFGTQTQGIDGSELRRWKAAGECQCCARPQDRKGGHKTLDCHREIRKKKGTADFPGK